MHRGLGVALVCSLVVAGCESRRVGVHSPTTNSGTEDAGSPDSASPHLPAPSPDGAMPQDVPDGGRTRDAAVDADTNRTQRHFLMAAGGVQMLVGDKIGFGIADDAYPAPMDMAAVHQEFYGIPWQAYFDAVDPDPLWLSEMQRLATIARAAAPQIFLSLGPLNGDRSSLAARTIIRDGRVDNEDGWAAACYDFDNAPDADQVRSAYLAYVRFMVGLFKPSHLAIGIEVNLYFEKCPGRQAGLVGLLNAAYDAAKAVSPETRVFPTIQIDHLYGEADDACAPGQDKASCFDANYAEIATLKRDLFAMSSYPYFDGTYSPQTLPHDWFSRGADRGSEVGFVAETGWLSTVLSARRDDGSCPQVIISDEATAGAYLQRLLTDAERLDLAGITWWSQKDLLPSRLMDSCECGSDPQWCAIMDVFRAAGGTGPEGAFFGEVLLKAFGSMGLHGYDGTEKPALLTPWRNAFATP